jgi:predicted protein tyrosine phosphatase
MSPRIVTTLVYPPIPIRSMDWQAHYAGEEDEQMATGHGVTEAEAVYDLIENHPREENIRLHQRHGVGRAVQRVALRDALDALQKLRRRHGSRASTKMRACPGARSCSR